MEEVWNGDAPRVEFLILAEHVEAIHGKLYLMGGAWETIHVARFDVPVALSVAVSVQVPWNATNQQHAVSVSVQTADGEVLTAEERQVMVGRPAHVEPGTSQRTLLVLEMSVDLPRPDRYVVVAAIGETPQARVSFSAVSGHLHTQ
jgi:hypothetical protein